MSDDQLDNLAAQLVQEAEAMTLSTEKPAAPKATEAPEAPNKAVQEALSNYHVCKDGTVVSNPKDCHGNNVLPTLSLDSVSKV